MPFLLRKASRAAVREKNPQFIADQPPLMTWSAPTSPVGGSFEQDLYNMPLPSSAGQAQPRSPTNKVFGWTSRPRAVSESPRLDQTVYPNGIEGRGRHGSNPSVDTNYTTNSKSSFFADTYIARYSPRNRTEEAQDSRSRPRTSHNKITTRDEAHSYYDQILPANESHTPSIQRQGSLTRKGHARKRSNSLPDISYHATASSNTLDTFGRSKSKNRAAIFARYLPSRKSESRPEVPTLNIVPATPTFDDEGFSLREASNQPSLVEQMEQEQERERIARQQALQQEQREQALLEQQRQREMAEQQLQRQREAQRKAALAIEAKENMPKIGTIYTQPSLADKLRHREGSPLQETPTRSTPTVEAYTPRQYVTPTFSRATPSPPSSGRLVQRKAPPSLVLQSLPETRHVDASESVPTSPSAERTPRASPTTPQNMTHDSMASLILSPPRFRHQITTVPEEQHRFSDADDDSAKQDGPLETDTESLDCEGQLDSMLASLISSQQDELKTKQRQSKRFSTFEDADEQELDVSEHLTREFSALSTNFDLSLEKADFGLPEIPTGSLRDNRASQWFLSKSASSSSSLDGLRDSPRKNQSPHRPKKHSPRKNTSVGEEPRRRTPGGYEKENTPQWSKHQSQPSNGDDFEDADIVHATVQRGVRVQNPSSTVPWGVAI